MTAFVDLAVAGGGPAGLAAAIEAARVGLNVLVLDPRRGVIDKACGEGIMPAGVEALEELGLRPHGVPFIGVEYADAVDLSALMRSAPTVVVSHASASAVARSCASRPSSTATKRKKTAATALTTATRTFFTAFSRWSGSSRSSPIREM